MDPYDFAAERLPTDTRNAIAAFWDQFTAQADGLDRCFSTNMTDMTVDPTEVMAALQDVSPDLMWEFGASDRGHALTITAEWNDEIRPLARAIHHMAPDLPRWQFHEARPPGAEVDHIADYVAQRFGAPLILTRLDASVGKDGRIDLAAFGPGDKKTLFDQALSLATSLFGEATERDWVGFVDSKPAGKPGLFSRLRGQPQTEFSAADFADNFRAAIAKAKSGLPAKPYAATPLDDRGSALFRVNITDPNHPRADLFTFVGPSTTYGNAVLSGGRFSSLCHSTHGEWFLFLRIPRTDDMPFDRVEERSAIEEHLHAALSRDRLGGTVGAGHGHQAVYIDLAVTDVAQGVARISEALKSAPYAAMSTLHFLDQGLRGLVLPAAPDTEKPN